MPASAEIRPHTRVLRGICAAGFATLLALLGHLVGGGPMPGWQGIFVPVLFTAFVAVLIGGHRATLPRLWAISAVAQVFFHTLFVLGTSSAIGSHAAAGHAHHVDPAVFAGAADHEHHWSMWMATAHLVAALVTALLQLHAERALLALLNFTYFVLSVFTLRASPGPLPALPRPRLVHSPLPSLTLSLLATWLFTRGPPAPTARHLRTA